MPDKLGRDDFIYSILDKNLELALELITAVADYDYQDKNGYSYLHAAVQSELQEIVALLVEKGANVNAQDKFGRTPLMVAIIYHRDNKEMISYLIDNGADAKIQNNSGVSSYDFAKKCGIEL